MVIEPVSSGDSTRSARQTGSALPLFMMYSTLNTTMAIVHELQRLKTLARGLTGVITPTHFGADPAFLFFLMRHFCGSARSD
jgi:hypothetical protein